MFLFIFKCVIFHGTFPLCSLFSRPTTLLMLLQKHSPWVTFTSSTICYLSTLWNCRYRQRQEMKLFWKSQWKICIVKTCYLQNIGVKIKKWIKILLILLLSCVLKICKIISEIIVHFCCIYSTWMEVITTSPRHNSEIKDIKVGKRK